MKRKMNKRLLLLLLLLFRVTSPLSLNPFIFVNYSWFGVSVFGTVNLLKDLKIQANHMCNNVGFDCYYNTIQTFRGEKVKWVNNQFLEVLGDGIGSLSNDQLMLVDVHLLGLTYAYEQTQFDHSTSVRKVCLIGNISLKLILSMLSSDYLLDVTFANFEFSKEDLNLMRIIEDIVSNIGGNVNAILLDELLNNEGGDNEDESPFDLIHFRCNNMLSEDSLTYLVSSLSRTNNHNPRIIWEKCGNYDSELLKLNSLNSIEESMRNNPFVGKIHWKMHFPWPVNSAIEELRDSQGFLSRRFGIYLDGDVNLLDLRIGMFERNHISNSIVGDSVDNEQIVEKVVENVAENVIILLTYTVRIFEENAIGFQAVLQSLGYRQVYIIGELTLDDINQYRNGNIGKKLIQIVFGAHEATLLLDTYIVYQAEQMDGALTPNKASLPYQFVLAKAAAVLVFSEQHRRELISRKLIPSSRIFTVPFYSCYPICQDANINVSVRIDALDQKELEILFFGGLSQRRKQWLQNLLPDLDKSLDGIPLRLVTGSMSNFVYGSDRDQLVERAGVVVYMHGIETSSLSVHRIHYLLSKGKCVVAERSTSDPTFDEQYQTALHFVDSPEDLFSTAIELMKNTSARLACEVNSKLRYKEMMNDTAGLRNALESKLW